MPSIASQRPTNLSSNKTNPFKSTREGLSLKKVPSSLLERAKNFLKLPVNVKVKTKVHKKKRKTLATCQMLCSTFNCTLTSLEIKTRHNIEGDKVADLAKLNGLLLRTDSIYIL